MNLFSTGGIFSGLRRNHAEIPVDYELTGHVNDLEGNSYNVTTGKESLWGRFIGKIKAAFSYFNKKDSEVTVVCKKSLHGSYSIEVKYNKNTASVENSSLAGDLTVSETTV